MKNTLLFAGYLLTLLVACVGAVLIGLSPSTSILYVIEILVIIAMAITFWKAKDLTLRQGLAGTGIVAAILILTGGCLFLFC